MARVHRPIPEGVQLAAAHGIGGEEPFAVLRRLENGQRHSPGQQARLAELRIRTSQQAAIAELGQRALRGLPLAELLDLAVALVAHTLQTEFGAVLELQPAGAGLLLRAGLGWSAGTIGHTIVPAMAGMHSGYTLAARKPVAVEDFGTETRFAASPVLRAHGVASGMSVVIPANGAPYGLLAVYDRRPRKFTKQDAYFLESAAHVLASAVDRLETEAQLRRSEELYRNLVETARDVVYTLAPDGTFLSLNPSFEALTGWPRGEWLGHSFTGLIHPDDLARVTALFQRAVAGEQPPLFEVRIRTRTGDPRVVEVTATPLHAGDHVAAVLGIARDVTSRRQIEDDHQRLTLAIEQVGESVVITDARGTIQYVNPSFERLTGYSRAEATSQNPRILKSGQQDAAFYRAMWDTLGRGETWHGHFSNKRKDGTLFEEEAVISPVRDAAGQVTNYVAVKRDVTRERQLEQQFRQAQKMEAVGRLAGGVAHDFNNILTAIMGYSALLQRFLPPADPASHHAREIGTAADRAAGLTRQLLAFSRNQVLQPTVFNLSRAVTDLEKMLRRLIGEDIELRTVASAEPVGVRADVGQLEQVILNLVVNARDAMAQGGTLTIETSAVTLDDSYAQAHHGVPSGSYALLVVTDTGCGMTPEVKAHLFEPFFTTKPQGQGTGLGLPTCYGIVKQSGGHITVYSEPGQGTVFRVYLPLLAVGPAAAPASRQPQELPRGTETVLLVEDEDAVRSLAALVLREQGYTVLEAAHGADALAAVRARTGAGVDLVITDVVMPQMGGRELADAVRAIQPGVRVMFSSGYTADVIVRQRVLAPAAAFLQKPYSPAALARKVRAVLDQPLVPETQS